MCVYVLWWGSFTSRTCDCEAKQSFYCLETLTSVKNSALNPSIDHRLKKKKHQQQKQKIKKKSSVAASDQQSYIFSLLCSSILFFLEIKTFIQRTFNHFIIDIQVTRSIFNNYHFTILDLKHICLTIHSFLYSLILNIKHLWSSLCI